VNGKGPSGSADERLGRMISDVTGFEVSFASLSMTLTPRSAPGQGLRDREMEASLGSSCRTPSEQIHNARSKPDPNSSHGLLMLSEAYGRPNQNLKAAS
jgi:hypothetical protein